MRPLHSFSTFAIALLAAMAFAIQPVAAQSILRDAETEALLRDMAYPLIEASELEPENVEIVLINDPSINAFVAGGQVVYVHAGLINAAETANEVQGVLAHELGHITAGHVVRFNERTRSAQGITILSLLLGVGAALAGAGDAAIGTLLAGWAGKRYSKKYLLAGIYTGRTIICAIFIMMPITPTSVIIFSIAMGTLWLATIPLTSGLVGYIYGLRYMATLYGLVFFSHQIGSFLGVWLGGKLYDIHGDYTLVWWVGVAVGAFSAIIHLPIREAPSKLPAAA